jgi:hypothetical protein
MAGPARARLAGSGCWLVRTGLGRHGRPRGERAVSPAFRLRPGVALMPTWR